MPARAHFFILLAAALAGVAGAAATTAPADILRDRITRQALQQAERISPQWERGQRDCAGFVRFLYRSSVTGVARMWMGKDHSFHDFLRAEELVGYNFESLGFEPPVDRLKTGDLLVFHDPSKPDFEAWHLMVLLEPPAGAVKRWLTVYHNGASGAEGGIRKVWLETLQEPLWVAWRPVRDNVHFQGFFRWKGWDSEKWRKMIGKAGQFK